MAITLRAAGSWAVSNATTQTVTLPTHATGDMIILRFAVKPFNAAPTVSTPGWTLVDDPVTGNAPVADGSTANGDGVGSVLVGAFWKIAESASETNPEIAWGTTSAPGAAVALSYQKAANDKGWDKPLGAGGADVDVDTSKSMDCPPATSAPPFFVRAGDMLDFFLAVRDDSTMTSPSVTQAGATFDAVSEQPAAALSSTTSNDIAADGGYRLVTGAGNSGSFTVTGTLSTSETGAAWVTLLRIVGIVELDVTGSMTDVDDNVLFGSLTAGSNTVDVSLHRDTGSIDPGGRLKVAIDQWRWWEGTITQVESTTRELVDERFLHVTAVNDSGPDSAADSGVALVLGDYRNHSRTARVDDATVLGSFETYVSGLWPGLTFDLEMDIPGLSNLTGVTVSEVKATWPHGADGPPLYEVTYIQGDTQPEMTNWAFEDAGITPDPDIGGMTFTDDANLYRSGAGELTTDGDLIVGGSLTPEGGDFTNSTTPTINNGGTATFGSVDCTWVKMGRVVVFNITFSVTAVGSGAGVVTITGTSLPQSAVTPNQFLGDRAVVSAGPLLFRSTNSGGEMQIQSIRTVDTATNLTGADLANTATYRVNGAYLASS